MAEGRVVAEGTASQIIGSARVTMVEAADWAAAFGALEAGGLAVALVETTLRVPGADPARVRQALAGLPAQVTDGPATLDERFFELTLAAAGARATG